MIFQLLFTTYSIVRLTSPNLNYYIVVGSLCLYGSIYIRIYPASSELFTHARCNVSVHITVKCRQHSLQACYTDCDYVLIVIFCNTQIQNILGCIGYVLIFAPVLVKMWRVYYIFHNPSPRKKVSRHVYHSSVGTWLLKLM